MSFTYTCACVCVLAVTCMCVYPVCVCPCVGIFFMSVTYSIHVFYCIYVSKYIVVPSNELLVLYGIPVSVNVPSTIGQSNQFSDTLIISPNEVFGDIMVLASPPPVDPDDVNALRRKILSFKCYMRVDTPLRYVAIEI